MQTAATLDALLNLVRQQSASDLHLSAGRPAMLRVDGRLVVANDTPLDSDTIAAMLGLLMPKAEFDSWQQKHECDFACDTTQGRFRINAYHTHQGAAVAIRALNSTLVGIDMLTDNAHIHQSLQKIASLQSGLVLVTGATGSGKSTTLAALVDYINEHRAAHILTIEDPIEFIHECKSSLISQRQVGTDTQSFEQALRAALREDPDVILVGELRDLQTIRLALTAAETGHLVLATLHTMSASKSIDRIVDVFGAAEKHMVRTMLADSLQAVVAQRLLPATNGGRVAAFEILLRTPAVANLIRENKSAQLPSVIQTGLSAGMISLESSLNHLLRQGKISQETKTLAIAQQNL